MRRLSHLAYIVASLEFVREGHSTGVVLALILLGWSILIEAFVTRSAVPRALAPADGWTIGNSRESADLLTRLQSVSFLADFMAYGLMLFSPLLAVWAFLL
ncbi:MAG: hypothetical protein ACR2QK_15755 [Acidimicrobiales bacterium]